MTGADHDWTRRASTSRVHRVLAEEDVIRERRPLPERRKVPSFTGRVMVPFRFFDKTKLRQLDLLDDERGPMEIATGNRAISREPRPNDPFTAWVAFAYMGCIEVEGPLLDPKLNREQRLDVARTVLTDEEVTVVESIAVPIRYRALRANELEELIRTAPNYIDRMWAGCWLELIGWTKSRECSFRSMGEMPACSMGELEETIVEAYAQSLGVISQDDALGWWRIDTSYEANLVNHRLSICEAHFLLNGPPPYEYMEKTVPLRPGWKQVVRLVPERPR
jgi:hypothetical protein